MARGIHDILEWRMKNGIYSSTDILTAYISYTDFVYTQSSDYKEVIKNFAKEVEKMIHLFPVPTMNPFIDKLEEYNSDNGLECLNYYIKENMTVLSQDQADNLLKLDIIFLPQQNLSDEFHLQIRHLSLLN